MCAVTRPSEHILMHFLFWSEADNADGSMRLKGHPVEQHTGWARTKTVYEEGCLHYASRLPENRKLWSPTLERSPPLPYPKATWPKRFSFNRLFFLMEQMSSKKLFFFLLISFCCNERELCLFWRVSGEIRIVSERLPLFLPPGMKPLQISPYTSTWKGTVTTGEC